MDVNLTLALLLFFPYLTRASVLGRDEAEENGTGDLSGLHGDLAFSLFRALADNTPHDNVLFSPFAVSSALAFLSRGSDSQTQTEILSALGISDGDSVERACSAWRDLVESLTEIHLATGTSLHVERSSLSSEPQDRSRSNCDGDLRPVDFSTPQQVKETINSYIEKETMGNITDFFQSISISAKTVLANYMYFKGKWEKPFVRRHTVSWRFQVNGSLAVEVPMMFRDDTEELKMLYDTNCSSTVVQLPYTGSLAMLLLLPKGEMGHLWPDTCLSVTRMKFWLTNLKPGRAEIRIPKFVLRKSYPLQSILKPTVVQTLFTDSVDLTGFSLNRKLSLQAIHEAIIELDETESDTEGGKSAMLDFSEPQRIVFDHPFMLWVYHESTGTILLIGKIINPAEN